VDQVVLVVREVLSTQKQSYRMEEVEQSVAQVLVKVA
jgi:hypothetical protein